MNGLFKMSQSSKKLIATVALAIVAIVFAITGVAMLKVNAEPLSSAIVNEDGTLNTLTPPTNGGYYGVAHYEFNEGALGKDSLGNFDLSVEEGVTYNTATYTTSSGVEQTEGGAKIGGRLIAKNLDGASSKDFSDLVDGSFSISMRAFMMNSGKQNVRLLCSGDGNKAFTVLWRHTGFRIQYYDRTAGTNSGSTIATNTNSAITTAGKYIFDMTQSWYRITIIYNAEEDKIYLNAFTDRGDSTQNIDFSATLDLTMDCDFGGYVQNFTIGGQSNSEYASHQLSTAVAEERWPTISDLRIYSGVIDQAELDAIAAYDAANANEDATDDNPTTAGMEKTLLANNSTILGASLRLSEESGLRFMANVNESYVDKFADYENVEFGVKLIRNHNDQKAYAYLPAVNKDLVDGVYSFNAVITELTEEYYATEFTAQVYISYTVGGETVYVVSDIPVEEQTRSISSVAQSALNDVYTVDVDGTLEDKPSEYAHLVSEGVYSRFDQTTRDKLSIFIVG